ncbi:hypothetical protein NW759_014391 [Fusarium solani]|nr:hypothetical protein NW759_014391 [Fusarium solani]
MAASRLGCWDKIEAEGTEVLETRIRGTGCLVLGRCNVTNPSTKEGVTNQELMHVHMPDIRNIYGCPHCSGYGTPLDGGL